MGKKIIQASPLLFFLIGIVFCQTIYTEYVVTDSDTVDTFSYQIPFNYLGNEPVPLLVVFHQWGGNESSSYYTEFDEEANNRGWIYLSPYGGSPNNYNHQSVPSDPVSSLLISGILMTVDYYYILFSIVLPFTNSVSILFLGSF